MRTLIGLALAAVCTQAYANAGIGFFIPVLPVLVLGFALIVPVEAFVLRPLLKVPLRVAFTLSFWANLRSTLWGLGLGIAIDVVLVMLTGSAGLEPSGPAAVIALIPLLFYTWWIEHRAIARRLTETSRGAIARASLAANLVSYALLGAGAWFIYPPYGTTNPRAHVSEAILSMAGLRTEVTEYWDAHRRFPTLAELRPLPPNDKFELSLGRDGEISVRILKYPRAALEGKRIRLKPVVENGALKAWRCGSSEIEPRYLPSSCRDTWR
jgi:hypothetical protein